MARRLATVPALFAVAADQYLPMVAAAYQFLDGRRPALVATLLTMGTATFLTGLLPTYSQIGVWAPVLLVSLRIIQGLAVGGEWGGAVLIAVEHAPARSKTFYGGFVQLGNPAGAILATGVFSILAATGDDSLQQWAWRIPFLISAVLIVFGLYVRSRVEESPLFKHEAQPPGAGIASLKAAVATNWKPILLGIGMVATPSGGYYILTTYATAYATSESVGLSPSVVLNVMTLGAFCELIVTLPTAWLGDKLGRVRVFIAGIDLCLHLVRTDHGAAYAAQIARNMVLPPHREGSQLQYATQPVPARADESLAPLLEWAISRLDSRLTVGRLAERAGLSSRTLARQFTERHTVSSIRIRPSNQVGVLSSSTAVPHPSTPRRADARSRWSTPSSSRTSTGNACRPGEGSKDWAPGTRPVATVSP